MTARLSPQREAEIASRAEAATPGPWELYEGYGKDYYAWMRGGHLRGVGTLDFGEGDDAEADRAFVLNAREDVDLLLAELAAVRAERDRYRAAWQSASFRAEARGEGILRITRDRESYQGWLKQEQAHTQHLRSELAKYVGKEPTIAEEMEHLIHCLDAVSTVCDEAEKQATRWENPLPVPEWVATVRRAVEEATS